MIIERKMRCWLLMLIATMGSVNSLAGAETDDITYLKTLLQQQTKAITLLRKRIEQLERQSINIQRDRAIAAADTTEEQRKQKAGNKQQSGDNNYQRPDNSEVNVNPIDKSRSQALGNTRQTMQLNWAGAPVFKAPAKGLSFDLIGGLQTDMVASHSRQSGVDYSSGTLIRRVRLGAKGTLSGDFSYKVQLDFNNGKADFEDMYLGYQVTPALSARLGYHEVLMSLDDEISDTVSSFLERSIYNTMSLGRAIGLSAAYSGKRWTLQTGVFGNSSETVSNEIDEGTRVSARLTAWPWQRDERLLHIGVSTYQRLLAESQNNFRLASAPESSQLNKLFDTGAHSADKTQFVGMETALQWHSWLLQAEYGRQSVDYIELADADFDAGYAQIAWVATGEQRAYNTIRGSFGSITPQHSMANNGMGALEFALRYSSMDLHDAQIAGGQGDIWTLGINWYPLAQVKLSANWVRFDISNSTTTLPNNSADHRGDIFAARMQLAW